MVLKYGEIMSAIEELITNKTEGVMRGIGIGVIIINK